MHVTDFTGGNCYLCEGQYVDSRIPNISLQERLRKRKTYARAVGTLKETRAWN